MGKASIVSGGPDGSYSITLDMGEAARTARLAALDEHLSVLVGQIATAQTALNAQQGVEDAKKVTVQAAIAAYVAAAHAVPVADATLKAALSAYLKRSTELLAEKRKTAPLRLALEALQAVQTQAQKDRAYWAALVLSETRQAWCADLTEDATGSVATLEIPGESTLVLIEPGAPPPTAEHGLLTAREVQSGPQAFWNAAVLPGWQKWRPTYRRGVITAINTGDDTADLTLTNDTSSAQKLEINQENDLKNVPIEYMTCNSGAFTVGDRCVVKFIDQDFLKPKVVGFVDNPKACGYVLSGVIEYGLIVSVPVPPNSPPGTLPTSTLRSYKPTAQAYQYMLQSDPAKSTTTFSDEVKLGRQGDQYQNICASMYSGLMARAVQVIMGQGFEVKYDYRWSNCHGITLDSDGKPWLIEISVTNGVIAMPLPVTPGSPASTIDVIRESVSLFKGIPTGASFPAGAALAAALTAGTVIRLATTAAMAGYFANTPYVENMGWSFNLAGSEAHNTCYGDGALGANYCRHYKLDLSIVRQQPDPALPAYWEGAASVSLVSEGQLRSDMYYVRGAMPFVFANEYGGAVWPPYSLVELPPAHIATIFVCHINDVLETVVIDISDYMTGGYESPTPDYQIAPYKEAFITVYENGQRVVARSSKAHTNSLAQWVVNRTEYLRGPIEEGASVVVFRDELSYVSPYNTLSWPGTDRDCYCFSEDKNRLERFVSYSGYVYGPFEGPGTVSAIAINYPGPDPDYSYMGFNSFNLVLPNERSEVGATVKVFLSDGTVFERVEDTSLPPYGYLQSFLVRESMFGGTPHATASFGGAGGYRMMLGAMLTTEATPGEASSYNFIGYL